MHLSDGVISIPMVVATTTITGGLLFQSIRKVKEEQIPMISLLSGGFFVFSLISLPIGPTSVHPLLAGLLGIMLGGKAVIALFIGLLLQAILFQHGGLTTLGVNTLLVAVPALMANLFFNSFKLKSIFLKGFISGVIGVIGCVLLLVSVLYFSSPHYSNGFFSVIHLIIVNYLPLLIIEGLLTGFSVEFISRIRPSVLSVEV